MWAIRHCKSYIVILFYNFKNFLPIPVPKKLDVFGVGQYMDSKNIYILFLVCTNYLILPEPGEMEPGEIFGRLLECSEFGLIGNVE